MNFHAIRGMVRTSLVRTAMISTIVALAACATTSSMPAKVASGAFTDQKGMTLYTFDKDTTGSGKSVCNGPCAANWPAFVATAADTSMGEWSVVTRDDGMKQWAYKGKPLYTFAKDTAPGEMKGDGFLNGAWHTAKP
jgi:predicted lipoprotein with Yx(FWY)xxD motif